MGYELCRPNEVLVVSGFGIAKPRIITSGHVWVWPAIQRVQRISVKEISSKVCSNEVRTSDGISATCVGVVEAKIAINLDFVVDIVREMLLDKSEEEIKNIVVDTVQGHQSAIVRSMTMKEIYFDRKKFSLAVFEVASSDLTNMGLTIVSYSLKTVTDSDGYLVALGNERARQQREAGTSNRQQGFLS